MDQFRIMVRGAGDIATGTIHRLWMAGFRPVVLETDKPSAIRRQVSLCECVCGDAAVVEGLTAKRAISLAEAVRMLEEGVVPVLVDPAGKSIGEYRPDVLIDAILAKKNLGTGRDMAPTVIGLGPGFCAGEDVDYVIETMRGHNLGRIITEGCAQPNTGIPGVIGGYGKERVIHAPAAGVTRHVRNIGDTVEKGEVILRIHGSENEVKEVPATISGLIRGMIRDGYPVTEGFKIADIDPRQDQYRNCFTISDKARCIAGSVLELVCAACREKQSKSGAM
ncbi:MAG: selenium-dependent molybdenum cofactor biosynthesis protein YqeB [[Clostridium] aminophilum]|uniref:selenium-dependent molybdenum cofactor biosynthesis protein YqeB n=1 Tax=[Clostridium] aminophilum TaxID=1526 RepID=UPI0026E94EC1|nr:selenium-dependent molybdenum cofactor biosynthesis protein YqeB [[Clostridium] aminophilum]MDD6196019.1 selenium-dependent molybdenum cofactor biosynthesis protein YqeB [[Clostridium] aminophilum]